MNRMNAGRNKIVYDGTSGDSTQLIFLRARWYNPADGRFQSRDTWEGSYNSPQSLNRWNYTQSNPINFTDPTGMYTYDRTKAASYAMNWDHQGIIDPEYDFTGQAPEMDWSSECTLFASSVLHYGGVRDPREDPIKAGGATDLDPPYWDIDILKAGGWMGLGYAGKGSWYNTDAFHNFATNIIGTSVLSFDSPPKYIDYELTQNAAQTRDWVNQLNMRRGQIQEGDLVFYDWPSPVQWDHVAVVVGWGIQTAYAAKEDPGSGPTGNNSAYSTYEFLKSLECNDFNLLDRFKPGVNLKPLVVERSGGIDYPGWRSLDNTYRTISIIDIVHIQNR